MKSKSSTGYSPALAQTVLQDQKILIATDLEHITPQQRWEDGKPTDEITGYKTLFIVPGDFFNVKLEEKPKSLPSYGSEVNLKDFEDLQAVEVQGQIYFKAKAFRKAK